MRIRLAVVLCVAMGLGCGAAFAEDGQGALTVDSQLNGNLVRLGGQLMVAGQAYEYDRHLADDIGGRLTGSANYVKAAEWGRGGVQADGPGECAPRGMGDSGDVGA